MDLAGLSITELKQLLAQVNHDLKLNKPTMNRKAKAAARIATVTESEGIICNKIAAVYTGNKALPPSDNDKLRADIQIQKDILEFINNGGDIKTTKRRKQVKPLSTTFGAFTMNYSL
jgi:hypothetical protein